MIDDARSVPTGETLRADLCIVGAGPAGLTLALELATTGAKTLLLESGSAGWSWRGKDLARGESASPHYYRLEWTRLRTFGGSSWAWRRHGLRTRPLEHLDFLARPEIGRGGWPLEYAELEPYWAPASALCGLDPTSYETERWEGLGPATLSVDASLETVMFPVAPGDAFTRLRHRVQQLASVTCLLHATVLELTTDDAGRRVERAWVTSGSGRSFMVEAGYFILAAGGIENARLLLLSRGTHSRGLGNRHDLVGRYFMEHPHVRSGVLRTGGTHAEPDTRLYQGVGTDGARAIGFLRLSDEVLRREALPGSAWAIHPATEELVSDAGRSLTEIEDTLRSYWRVTPKTGRRVVTVARHPLDAVRAAITGRAARKGRAAARVYRLLGMLEQRPNANSRVALGNRRDRYGQPMARLEWQLTTQDHQSIRRTQEVLSAALERAGVGVVDQRYGEADPPPLLGGGFHHMGTTRMDPDPRRGVVDLDSRVHGLANLYVAGSSVFPTAGFANPTLTLVALTLRLARHLSRSELKAA